MKNVIDVPQSAESYNELLQQAVSLIESGRCFAAKQGRLMRIGPAKGGHWDVVTEKSGLLNEEADA